MMMHLRVLVADDNEDAANTLAILLGLWGCQVVVAYDGLDALQAARQNNPDVAFLDVQMPKLGGGEVARRLRRDRSAGHCHIIAMTALDSNDARLREYEDVFDAYLRKPYDAGDLKVILRDAAGTSHDD